MAQPEQRLGVPRVEIDQGDVALGLPAVFRAEHHVEQHGTVRELEERFELLELGQQVGLAAPFESVGQLRVAEEFDISALEAWAIADPVVVGFDMRGVFDVPFVAAEHDALLFFLCGEVFGAASEDNLRLIGFGESGDGFEVLFSSPRIVGIADHLIETVEDQQQTPFAIEPLERPVAGHGAQFVFVGESGGDESFKVETLSPFAELKEDGDAPPLLGGVVVEATSEPAFAGAELAENRKVAALVGVVPEPFLKEIVEVFWLGFQVTADLERDIIFFDAVFGMDGILVAGLDGSEIASEGDECVEQLLAREHLDTVAVDVAFAQSDE